MFGVDEYPEIIERISQKIAEKGINAEEDRIASKLRLLIEDFHIPPEEAENTVANEILRENNVSSVSREPSSETIGIADANPGDWVTIEGKVVSVSVHPHEAIAQTGIIADESGAIRFVIWEKAGAEPLEELRWYRIESAVVDEYRGAPSMKIHSGTTITKSEQEKPLMPTPLRIEDLKPGVATVRVKMIQNWEPRHENMLQSGLLGDETGTVKFITWKERNNEFLGESHDKLLEENKVYSIYYAVVDEYNGNLSLNISDSMALEEEGADIEVASGETEVTGAFVNFSPNSGLIKRCPVEGCNRALSRQNYCPVHEIQSNSKYDLRIIGVIDDGKDAHNVIIQRDETEKITGITLEKAMDMAENNPLGLDDVIMKMKEVLTGRYYTCRGSDIDGTVLVTSCTPKRFDSMEHAELLNRAAPENDTGGEY